MAKKGRAHTLDDDTRKRIYKLFKEGVTQSALAERFGLTQGGISNIIKTEKGKS